MRKVIVMRKQTIKRVGTLCLCVGMLLTLLSGFCLQAFAAGNVGSLTLICQNEDDILEGLKWDILRVGSRVGDSYVLEGEFSEAPVTMDDLSEDALVKKAKVLEAYAVANEIQPLASGATNEKGILVFDNLEEGLYLVWGYKLTKGNTTYFPSTMFVEIHETHAALDWNAYPKYYMTNFSTEEERHAVMKVWLNEDGEPIDYSTSITVEIYRDRELYDTVVLSEENDWKYFWTSKGTYDWFVYEVDIPEGFTVEYDDNKVQYRIKNIYHGEITTTTTTDTTETTETTTTLSSDTTSTTTTTTTTSQTTTTTITSKTTGTTTPNLPQTGQLWWPVLVLGALGMLFVAIGCRMTLMRNDEQESDEK